MSYYEVTNTIKSIDDLRRIFPTGNANHLNWCFFSTSGVHGLSRTLDDLDGWEAADPSEPSLTVCVVMPRICCIRYGNILAYPEDRPWLRGLVASTLHWVAESQAGNLPGQAVTDA